VAITASVALAFQSFYTVASQYEVLLYGDLCMPSLKKKNLKKKKKHEAKVRK
jgi:hypothetical protein